MERGSRNIYEIARRTAGYTQERWAEAVGVSVESIRNYEHGAQLPGDGIVKAMCEISGLSQLSYWHLCRKSALAAEILPEVESVPLPQAVCALLCGIREFVRKERDARLLDMAADGRIDELERADFDDIVKELRRIVAAAIQLRYAEGGGSGETRK